MSRAERSRGAPGEGLRTALWAAIAECRRDGDVRAAVGGGRGERVFRGRRGADPPLAEALIEAVLAAAAEAVGR